MPTSAQFPACGIAQTDNGPEFVVVLGFGSPSVIYSIRDNEWRYSATEFDVRTACKMDCSSKDT